jgi:preprotein translocase subunit SecF
LQQEFSFAPEFGILVSTYSSVAVAAPMSALCA